MQHLLTVTVVEPIIVFEGIEIPVDEELVESGLEDTTATVSEETDNEQVEEQDKEEEEAEPEPLVAEEPDLVVGIDGKMIYPW